MNRVRGGWKALAVAVAVLGLTSGSASADPTLDFQLGGPGGVSVNYVGGASPLTGSNIPIPRISSNSTPQNSGQSLSITDRTLSFTTGNFMSFSNLQMNFAGSGAISIMGDIAALGRTNATLLRGSFVGASVVPQIGLASVFIGTGADAKHPALVSHFFGNTRPENWVFSGLVLTERAALQPALSNAFKSAAKATSVDILNTAVPEVGSILMLGTSLLATAFLIRRRRSKGAV